jgi:hypothetical protein
LSIFNPIPVLASSTTSFETRLSAAPQDEEKVRSDLTSLLILRSPA